MSILDVLSGKEKISDWVKKAGEDLKATADDIADTFDRQQLTEDEREDYTASCVYLSLAADKFVPSVIGTDYGVGVYGIIKLGGELGRNEAEYANCVYYVTTTSSLKLGEDWRCWRKGLVKAMENHGQGDPRADERARTLTVIATVCGAVGGAVLTVLSLGAAAGVVGAVVTAGATAGFAAADAAEAKQAAEFARAGVSISVTGSSGAQKTAAAAGGAAGAATTGVLSQVPLPEVTMTDWEPPPEAVELLGVVEDVASTYSSPATVSQVPEGPSAEQVAIVRRYGSPARMVWCLQQQVLQTGVTVDVVNARVEPIRATLEKWWPGSTSEVPPLSGV